MQDLIPYITFVIGIGGLIFTIYNYFRNPQITSDKNDALMEQRIQNIELSIVNLRDNHIRSLDVKLDETNKSVSQVSIEVAKLGTIINERIPRVGAR